MAEKNKKMLYPEIPPLTLDESAAENSDNGSHINPDDKSFTNSSIPSNTPSVTDSEEDPDSIHPILPQEIKGEALPEEHTTSYKAFLDGYSFKIQELIDKFEDMRVKVQNHHYRSNCAKVSGTVVSTTGVALVMSSLVWAPLTAGSSLILGAGGAVMSVTGSLTNVLTDYIDYKKTKIIMEDIQILLKQKDVFDRCMKRSLEIFNQCIDKLVAQGVSREVAISSIVEGIAKDVLNIISEPTDRVLDSIGMLAKLYHIEHIALETLPVLGKTFHVTEKSFQFIYNILGMTGKTIPSLMKEFAKISGVLSVAFAITDISLLIKDLCSDHPSVDLIERVIAKLEDEKRVINDLLQILKDVGTNENNIFQKYEEDVQRLLNTEKETEDEDGYVIVNTLPEIRFGPTGGHYDYY